TRLLWFAPLAIANAAPTASARALADTKADQSFRTQETHAQFNDRRSAKLALPGLVAVARRERGTRTYRARRCICLQDDSRGGMRGGCVRRPGRSLSRRL